VETFVALFYPYELDPRAHIVTGVCRLRRHQHAFALTFVNVPGQRRVLTEAQATAKSSRLVEHPCVERLVLSVGCFCELHSHSLASALAPLRVWEITVARTIPLVPIRQLFAECELRRGLTHLVSCRYDLGGDCVWGNKRTRLIDTKMLAYESLQSFYIVHRSFPIGLGSIGNEVAHRTNATHICL
jgi:hypothetical protein